MELSQLQCKQILFAKTIDFKTLKHSFRSKMRRKSQLQPVENKTANLMSSDACFSTDCRISCLKQRLGCFFPALRKGDGNTLSLKIQFSSFNSKLHKQRCNIKVSDRNIIKAKKHIVMARQIYLYLLAGISSESIFGSDRSPICYWNIKILSLKGAQSI